MNVVNAIDPLESIDLKGRNPPILPFVHLKSCIPLKKGYQTNALPFLFLFLFFFAGNASGRNSHIIMHKTLSECHTGHHLGILMNIYPLKVSAP